MADERDKNSNEPKPRFHYPENGQLPVITLVQTDDKGNIITTSPDFVADGHLRFTAIEPKRNSENQ